MIYDSSQAAAASQYKGMSFLDKSVYRNAQLLGMPAGIQAYKFHSAAMGHGLGALSAGTQAAAREIADPFIQGGMDAFGMTPLTGGKKGISWLGFGFEKTGTFANMARGGQMPYSPIGHVFTKEGARAQGITSAMEKRAGARSAQKIFGSGAGTVMARSGKLLTSAIGPIFMAHAAVKGFEKNGIAGALGGIAVEGATFAGWHVGMRLLGPAAIPIIATGMAWSHAAKNIKADLAAAPRHAGYNIAGSLQAFTGGQAYTMRQRSMQAIQKHHLNARSALGAEASSFHVGSTRQL